MTKKTRTIIFLVCLISFVLIAPLAVFYSKGYRLDFESKKITQTGGFFLKVMPRQADIYIDGKLQKRTDFFFGSALIENLLPKKYKVEVKKEGYHSWEKFLEVKEKKVTEAKNIILFPWEINFNLLFSQVKDFWLSPDQKKIIIKEGEKESSWALKLYDLNKKIKSHLVSYEEFAPFFILISKSKSSAIQEDFLGEKIELVNLEFSEDSKKIYLKIKAENQIKDFELDLSKARPSLNEIKPPQAPAENIVAYQKISNNIYYLDNLGHLFLLKNILPPFVDEEKNLLFWPPLNESAIEKEKLSLEPFPLKKEAQYDLKIFYNFIFLQEDKTLYKFEHHSKTFQYFFEGANALKLSPNNKVLAFFSDYEIWLLFLSDKNDPPQKKAGENLFLIRLSEKITDFYWINPDYLIFQTEEKIKISETDERDKPNIIDLFELKKLPQNGSSPKIFFNQFDKKIYLLSENNLYDFDPLIP